MKISLDTGRDSPRLIRAAIAFLLSALDNGTAIPLRASTTGVIASEAEHLELDTRREDAAPKEAFAGNPAHTLPDPTQQGFGGSPAPSTAAAAPSPNAPAPLPGALPPGATSPPALSLVPPVGAPPVNAPAPAPAPGAELDKAGLPWDERIHAGTKTKDAKGIWKYAKGIDRVTLVPAVEAQNRQLMAIPVQAPAVAPPVPNPTPLPPLSAGAPPVVPLPPQGAATPLPASGPLAASAGAADPADFGGFMTFATGLVKAGRITNEQLGQACTLVGLPNVIGLSARPELIPQMVATVKSFLG